MADDRSAAPPGDTLSLMMALGADEAPSRLDAIREAARAECLAALRAARDRAEAGLAAALEAGVAAASRLAAAREVRETRAMAKEDGRARSSSSSAAAAPPKRPRR